MPMRRAVLMIRQAISPRLAIRIFLNMPQSLPAPRSERNVVVLLPRVLELLVAQHGEGPADAAAGVARLDDVVEIAARCRHEGVGELLPVLLGARLDLRGVAQVARSDGRRVGQECVSTGRSRWSPDT